MEKITQLMSTILMVPNGVDGAYRPVKNTTKNDCYSVLGQLQEILRTNTSFPINLETEIRKPLEDEIERLKKENKQFIKDNRLLDETKYTAQQDDIDFFVNQERRRVITELEEWSEDQKENAYVDDYGHYLEIVKYTNLQQKLKEMKEEKQ